MSALIVPPTLQTSEHMFMSFARQTVPDLPAKRKRLPRFPLNPSSVISEKTQWVMAHSFWYTASKLMPLHTPIVPVKSLVTILFPVGLNLISIMGSECGFPSSFGALVSSFQMVILPEWCLRYHCPNQSLGWDCWDAIQCKSEWWTLRVHTDAYLHFNWRDGSCWKLWWQS